MSTLVWLLLIAIGGIVIWIVIRKKNSVENPPKDDLVRKLAKFNVFTTEKKKMARLLHEFCQENYSFPDDEESIKFIGGMCVALYKACFAMEGNGDFMEYAYKNAIAIQERSDDFTEEVRYMVDEQLYLGQSLNVMESFINEWSMKITTEIILKA